MDNNKENKTITMSLTTFIVITIIFVIIVAGVTGLYISGLLKKDKIVENKEKEALVKNESEEENIILDKVLETESISLKYPSDWEVEQSEAYAEPIILKAPGNDDEEKAKLYITVVENTGNRTAKEILESTTKPDYGVPTNTVAEGVKKINGIDGYYKTQSMSYDDGTSGKVTVVICIKDIYVYQLSFGGNNEEYEKYYPIFEKMLETVQFIENQDNTNLGENHEDIAKNNFISLSIDTANKKIVDEDIESYSISNNIFSSGIVNLSVRDGKVYLVNEMSNDKWIEYEIVEKESDIKVNHKYEAEIKGFAKKVVDVEMSCYGHTINEVFFVFLMEDGTLEYTSIENVIRNLTTEGKVDGVEDIQRIYNCSTEFKGGGGSSSIIALDSNNNMYDIGYILYKNNLL